MVTECVNIPAVISANGSTRYYNFNGKQHRLDGPAIIWPNGHHEWWANDQLHRLDGPARTWENGHQEWWVNGKRHREDGPARTWENGSQDWWVNDKRHREDGPAIIYADGREQWWVNSKKLESIDFDNWLSECSINPNWKEWTDDEKILFRLRF